MSARTKDERLNEVADRIYWLFCDMYCREVERLGKECNCDRCYVCQARDLINWVDTGSKNLREIK